MKSCSPQMYNKVFFVICGIGSIPFLLVLVFCWRVGETLSIEDVVRAQHDNHLIYGTALHNPQNKYKLELYDVVRPKLVVLGNSRSLSFREEMFFEKTFLNAGGSIQMGSDITKFFNRAYNIQKPETVIIVVDWTWFNQNIEDVNIFNEHEAGNLQIGEISTVISWILGGRISIDEIIESIAGMNNGIGLLYLNRGQGYTPYGAMVYGASRINLLQDGELYTSALSAVEFEERSFVPAESVSKTRWAEFKKIVANIEGHGVEVVLVYPPLSPTILRAVDQKPGLAYIRAVGNRLAAEYENFFNFLDISNMRVSDCEFVDGTHGGAVLYSRMLRQMASKPSNLLYKYTNQEALNGIIEDFSGLSTIERNWAEKERKLTC